MPETEIHSPLDWLYARALAKCPTIVQTVKLPKPEPHYITDTTDKLMRHDDPNRHARRTAKKLGRLA